MGIFGFFGFFLIFNFFLYKIFSLKKIFYEQIIYLQKNSKVCTQLRIFQKEVKSTLNQELMQI